MRKLEEEEVSYFIHYYWHEYDFIYEYLFVHSLLIYIFRLKEEK
jgi:hypothetical protein